MANVVTSETSIQRNIHPTDGMLVNQSSRLQEQQCCRGWRDSTGTSVSQQPLFPGVLPSWRCHMLPLVALAGLVRNPSLVSVSYNVVLSRCEPCFCSWLSSLTICSPLLPHTRPESVLSPLSHGLLQLRAMAVTTAEKTYDLHC